MMKKYLLALPFLLTLLFFSNCEQASSIVTCPGEALLPGEVNEDVYYDIYYVVLNNLITDEVYLNVLQQTDEKVVLTDVVDDLNANNMVVDSAVLADFGLKNPTLGHKQLENRFNSPFNMLAEKEFDCLQANGQYDARFPENNKIVRLTLPGISPDGKTAFLTYSAFCDSGCGASYLISLVYAGSVWSVTEKVEL